MKMVKILFWFFVVLLSAALLARLIGSFRFKQMVKADLRRLQANVADTDVILTPDDIRHLPSIVQQWLHRSGVVGKNRIQGVHLHQTGRMRTTPEGPWMPVRAEQYFSVARPGFVWVADVQAAPLVHLSGRDLFEDGKGHMLIKAASLIPVADARGAETDQGTLIRFLAEICWFPSAATADYIAWESVDSLSARATMRFGGTEGSGVFSFTPEGDLRAFDALRYYDRQGTATLEKWRIENAADSYRAFAGVHMPTRSSVHWLLDSGDFMWFELEVKAVEYGPGL
ncbi:MAG: DUF6544 family protein [Saprospiraceae bacterium]|nr:DUF6544 family protein [Saprospiraceae bacterium]